MLQDIEKSKYSTKMLLTCTNIVSAVHWLYINLLSRGCLVSGHEIQHSLIMKHYVEKSASVFFLLLTFDLELGTLHLLRVPLTTEP